MGTLKGSLSVRNSMPGMSRSHTGKPLKHVKTKAGRYVTLVDKSTTNEPWFHIHSGQFLKIAMNSLSFKTHICQQTPSQQAHKNTLTNMQTSHGKGGKTKKVINQHQLIYYPCFLCKPANPMR